MGALGFFGFPRRFRVLGFGLRGSQGAGFRALGCRKDWFDWFDSLDVQGFLRVSVLPGSGRFCCSFSESAGVSA